MKYFKENHKLGAFLAGTGILVAFLAMLLIASIYMPTVEGKILEGRPDEAITVRIVYALLGWIGLTAGAVWAVVLFGFIQKENWAWKWGVAASTMQILSGFFPMIPTGSLGNPTPTVWVFLAAFILWFMMLWIGAVPGKIVSLAFVTGLAYVMVFIDGVGAISRYQTVDLSFTVGMYAVGQMVNWWAATAWGVFIFGLVSGKTWTRTAGIFAASLAIFGGLPVGVTDVLRLSRFSMFLPGPLLSAVLLVIFQLPRIRKLVQEYQVKVNELK